MGKLTVYKAENNKRKAAQAQRRSKDKGREPREKTAKRGGKTIKEKRKKTLKRSRDARSVIFPHKWRRKGC